MCGNAIKPEHRRRFQEEKGTGQGNGYGVHYKLIPISRRII
jgi:hypothetical protein